MGMEQQPGYKQNYRRNGLVCGQIEEAGTAPKDGVMVCGDSGNDIELFAVPGVRGCMVVNAHPELRAWCDAHPSPSLFQASPASVIFNAMCHLTSFSGASDALLGLLHLHGRLLYAVRAVDAAQLCFQKLFAVCCILGSMYWQLDTAVRVCYMVSLATWQSC